MGNVCSKALLTLTLCSWGSHGVQCLQPRNEKRETTEKELPEKLKSNLPDRKVYFVIIILYNFSLYCKPANTENRLA